jgi:hypothetical protein
MDILTYAIDRIKAKIPRDILRLAYVGKQEWNKAPKNLDEEIRFKTIQSRVIVDTSLVGGDTVYIDISGLQPIYKDEYNYVFEVPPEKLQGRQILSVLCVNYHMYNMGTSNFFLSAGTALPKSVNDINMASHRAMDSRGMIPIISNSEIELVGQNTIMVKNHFFQARVVQLKCILYNDERLSNLNIRAAISFSELCTLACKSYIYNTLVVSLDKGRLEHGQELGIIKSVIESYSDAEQMYMEYLEQKWAAVGIINDRVTYEDLLRLQIDPSM